MVSLRIQAAVRGYHAYQTVWEPQTGNVFVVLHEPGNRHDRHAMGPSIVKRNQALLLGTCQTRYQERLVTFQSTTEKYEVALESIVKVKRIIIVLRLPNLCVILESIDLYCAEGCRIIRDAEFLEDIW